MRSNGRMECCLRIFTRAGSMPMTLVTTGAVGAVLDAVAPAGCVAGCADWVEVVGWLYELSGASVLLPASAASCCTHIEGGDTLS